MTLVPFTLLDVTASYAAGIWESYFLKIELPQYPVNFAFLVLSYFSLSYFRRRISSLQEYCVSLGTKADATLDVRGMTSTFRVFLLFVPLAFLIIAFYLSFSVGSFSLFEKILALGLPYLYFIFVMSAFIWAYGYSMYAVNKMGKLPLRLRPFTEDRVLGLRPFGSVSLRLTALFLGFMAVGALPAVVDPLSFGLAPAAADIFLGSWVSTLVAGALLLFLAPLRSIRRQLKSAKSVELAWVTPMRTELLQKIKSHSAKEAQTDAVNEFNSLGKIEAEIRQIPAWPFDFSQLARLLAIVFSVSAILLSRVISSILRI